MNKLNKLERHWVMYDVANSAFVLLATTIIPIYFKNLASASGVASYDSTAYISYAAAIVTIAVAILGPTIGTIADTKGYKKPIFTAFLLLGCICCVIMPTMTSWLGFLVLFIFAKIGMSSSIILNDSMLVDVTEPSRMDMLSTKGYAWGYIGSCVPFIISLVLILKCDSIGLSSTTATIIAFIITAVWWFTFSIPILKSYQQIHYVKKEAHAIRKSFIRLGKFAKTIKHKKKLYLFLFAFFFYIDGVYTIINLATSYGKDVGISDSNLLLALLLTQIVAFPCALIFGRLSSKYKPVNIIKVCIVGYFGIAVFALQLDRTWEFWLLAVAVAVFQGAIQSMSRSYFAKIIPKHESSEYFGFYDIFGKGATFFGAMLMGISTQIFSSSRAGVAALALLFPLGYYFLCKSEKADEITYDEEVN
ncbi:MAG: MFS transporter [Peptostreptococcaceae bacterium]|nr:MFS transporter [Peptostreptococcaceae bacterium]